MNVTIRDNARNVLVAPEGVMFVSGGVNLLGMLRDLKHCVVWTNGQCEYQCDQEFLDALKQSAEADELKELPSHAHRIKDGIAAVYEFDGVPLVVTA